MFVLALLALVVSAAALVFSVLSWWNGLRSARAAEGSAASAATSAEQAVASADAAHRSADAAQETLGYTREDREAQRIAERTPAFEVGHIDWRGNVLAADVPLRMTTSSPPVDHVDITLVGGVNLHTLGAIGGAAVVESVRWDRPEQLKPFRVGFRRDEERRYGPVIIRLTCTLTDEDGGAIRVVELPPV